jgi:hypothetical protein
VWYKSSFSNLNGSCVEVRIGLDGAADVRDSKDACQGPVLRFTPEEWHAFLDGVKKGEFDNPGAKEEDARV